MTTTTTTPTAAKPRRPRGEGSLYWSEARQCYVGVVDYGLGPGGKRQRRWVEGPSKAIVAGKMKQVRAEGPVAPKRKRGFDLEPEEVMTVGQWLDYWVANVLPQRRYRGQPLSPNTIRQYTETLTFYVKPFLGDTLLCALRPEHLVWLLAELERKGYSRDTRRLARTTLNLALTTAEEFERIRKNPTRFTQSPGRTVRLDDALSFEEAEQVLATAEGDRFEALAVLLLLLGLREGEAIALRWSHIDLKRGWIKVPGTKSESSKRVLPLPDTVAKALEAHQHAQKVERMAARVWIDPAVVFANEVGAKLTKRQALSWWHALTIKAGVGRRRLHASRHTCGQLMHEKGVDLETISAILGHSSITITSDLYVKPGQKALEAGAQAMDELFGKGRRRGA